MENLKEKIENYIKQNNLSCKLVSDDFKRTTDVATFQCGCGNMYDTPIKKFLYRQKWQCNTCGIEMRRKSRIISFEEAACLFKNYGLTLLSTEINNCNDKLLCKNADGYYGLKTYHSLKNGNTFDIVSKHNPYSIQNIKHYIDIHNLSCDIISDEYLNARTRLTFVCECGNFYETTWQSFVTNHNDRCPVCTSKQSRYSLMVENYLKDKNLTYTKEYSFKDCKDNHVLLFDFAVVDEDSFILIEVDGETHYVPSWQGEEGLKRQQKRDEIKNEYCDLNNIKLIRIPYWEFNDKTYTEKLDKELSDIID